MNTIFTLETQMGKLTSNGCLVLILTIFGYNEAQVSLSPPLANQEEKIPLSIKSQEIITYKRSRGKGKEKRLNFQFPFPSLFFSFSILFNFFSLLSHLLLHLHCPYCLAREGFA